MEELRCVLAVVRHGDRTPKQKMKMKITQACPYPYPFHKLWNKLQSKRAHAASKYRVEILLSSSLMLKLLPMERKILLIAFHPAQY